MRRRKEPPAPRLPSADPVDEEDRVTDRDLAAEELPPTYLAFVERFPMLAESHATANRSVVEGGPLDEKTCELVKIAICLGAGLESALKAHVRRSRQAGASMDEIEQVVALGMTTLGWSRTVAGWKWAHDQVARDAAEA
jgi:4-carboxymuconolactone decarboxylase